MAELKAGTQAVGIARQAPKAPQAPAQPKTDAEKLQDARYLQGYEKGKHDKAMSNFWHGAIAAFICISIGATFTYLIQGANREQNMIDSRVAVGAAISNARLLDEASAMQAPVMNDQKSDQN